jgi:hypothetical protein
VKAARIAPNILSLPEISGEKNGKTPKVPQPGRRTFFSRRSAAASADSSAEWRFPEMLDAGMLYATKFSR